MFRAMCLVVVAVMAVAAISNRGVAATIHVPGEQPTIQAGIDAASEGDTVLVAAGTYTGPGNLGLTFGGTDLTVMSEDGPEATTIDCQGAGIAFNLFNGETPLSLVRGFTIANGGGNTNGGGMVIHNADATVENCIFANNTAGSNAGGLWYGYTVAGGFVSDCVFFGNTAEYRAGGMMADHATVTITGCLFYENTVTTESSQLQYGGGAIHGNSSTVTIANCTMARNAASTGAGGVYSYASNISVERCIVAFSTAGNGLTVGSATQCVIFENAGGDSLLLGGRDNLYVDPRFCAMQDDDYSLCANSVCLPGSPENPWGQLVGALGEGCGNCDSAVESMSWGRIRSLYR
jgi:hypothetical protein